MTKKIVRWTYGINSTPLEAFRTSILWINRVHCENSRRAHLRNKKLKVGPLLKVTIEEIK